MKTPEATPSPLSVPSLPDAGSAVKARSSDWGSVGANGTATLAIPLPVSAGRGYAPTLALLYRSGAGNSPYGFGWELNLGAITRCTRRAVPSYTAADSILGPDAQTWMPECDANGTPLQRRRERFNQLPLPAPCTVTRYFPAVESDFARIEHWRTAADAVGFWLIQARDGSQHVYGKTASARIANPDAPDQVAQWWLEESLNRHGEHIGYHYLRETEAHTFPYDCRAQHYLHAVYYGNVKAREKETLYLLHADVLSRQDWHFHLLLDYGQRSTAMDQVPPYTSPGLWPVRQDAFSSYAYGFELRTQRLCRQILMFHCFPAESAMGPAPVLVKRLLLEHQPAAPCRLIAVHEQAVDSQGQLASLPPQEFHYQSARLKLNKGRYQRLEDFPGLNDGQRYQVVDLYGEGLPGLFYRGDNAWFYRAPQRDENRANADAITYAPPQAIPISAMADTLRPVYQTLLDVDGDGRLEWVLARPGLSGFFRLGAQSEAAGFVPFDAFPAEYLHADAMFADLLGSGFADMALVGPRSVRLYANQQAGGFAAGIDLPHRIDGDDLPTVTSSARDWVGFSDILGSGQQHLVRIRHDEIKYWPNLGRGRFGKGRVLTALPFREATFNAANIVLADLNGYGGADLLYLSHDALSIYLNKGSKGFAGTPLKLPWPSGVAYDALCQVSVVDIRGQGLVSLIISVMHPRPQHWRYDFFNKRPGLLRYLYNNLGAKARITYRSSAQEWLDEKQELLHQGKPAVSRLPFALDLVKTHEQRDETTGGALIQRYQYRRAYYDPDERTFNGFGLLLQSDRETAYHASHTRSLLSKRWFHTGQSLDSPGDGYSAHDRHSVTLGPTLLASYEAGAGAAEPTAHHDRLITRPSSQAVRDATRALRGLPLRVEVFALDPPGAVPYSVQHHRYLVRQLAPVSGALQRARMLPLEVETVTSLYEQVADDPVCEHRLNLRWDAYGSLVHGVTVHHARRKTPDDPPPDVLTDAHPQQWWRDTHDTAQQQYYLSETLAQWIHHTQEDQWQLALPYRQRSNAWTLPKGLPPSGLNTHAISYEGFIQAQSGPIGPRAPRQLSGLSVQHYREPGGKGQVLEPGVATFQALTSYLETAELDAAALQALQAIPRMPGQPAWDLPKRLKEIGYQAMTVFFCASDEERQTPPTLWSIRRQFPRYRNAKHFYRLHAWRLTQAEDETSVTHDPYDCQVIEVKQADGCVTQLHHDYRLLQPVKLTDANGTVQQALLDAFGRVIARSVMGNESGTQVGFGALTAPDAALHTSVEDAIQRPETVLGHAARAACYAVFSWMGSIARQQIRPEWIKRRYLLPDGHIRSAARPYLKARSRQLTESERALSALIKQARRTPVHSLELAADRYPGDEARIIHMTLAFQDGAGRTLQRTQKAEPGPAYVMADNGDPAIQNSALRTAHADPRWCVSERTDYSLEGRIVRIYRPFFSDRHHFVNAEPLRKLWHSDTQLYDPLGRPVRTLTANATVRQTTYWAWYTISEDENDTGSPEPTPALPPA